MTLTANQPGAVNGGIALRLHCERLWPAVTDPDRSEFCSQDIP